MKRIKVIVVDDSAVVRQVNRETLEREADIEVIAACADPLFALEKMHGQWPDVIVTDIEMPRMDGISFIQKVMSERPTPIVVCSSLTEEGATTTLQALSAGALSIITKPKLGVKQFLQDAGNDIVSAVRSAAGAQVRKLSISNAAPVHKSAAAAPASGAMHDTTDKVVAIGTSTGGTQALEAVLTKVPVTSCGMVIVQHMPEKFTAMFAQRLNSLCQIEVREARHGDRVRSGLALIAPGGRHMQLKRSGAQYCVEVLDGPLVNRHKPSVDVLFRSVARVAGRNALGIIMTGMGDDGARGLQQMHKAGAMTIAEDESSCIVFGMPREAIKLGAVDKVVALSHIPREIIQYAR